MASDKRMQAKADILESTISCISELGVSGATVRAIAEKANVNPAAISYYFGGRDQLIQAALEVTLDNAFDSEEFDFASDADYHDVLKSYIDHWVGGIFDFPGITQAHFDTVLNKRPNHHLITDGFNRFLDALFDLMVEHGLKDSADNRRKLRIIFGSMMSAALFPEIFKPGKSNSDFSEALVALI